MGPDAGRLLAGSAMLSNPFWMETFTLLWQGILSFGGGVIVCMSIYKLYLEIKIRRRTLSKP